jgi:hypothetical protein
MVMVRATATEVEKSRGGGRRVQVVEMPLAFCRNPQFRGQSPNLSVRPSGGSLVPHDFMSGPASSPSHHPLNWCDGRPEIPPGTHEAQGNGTNRRYHS